MTSALIAVLANRRPHFRFREDGQGILSVEVVGVGKTNALGEPHYNSDG